MKMKNEKTLPELIEELREAVARKERLLDPTPFQLKEEDVLGNRENWSDQDWADHFLDVDIHRHLETK